MALFHTVFDFDKFEGSNSVMLVSIDLFDHRKDKAVSNFLVASLFH